MGTYPFSNIHTYLLLIAAKRLLQVLRHSSAI